MSDLEGIFQGRDAPQSVMKREVTPGRAMHYEPGSRIWFFFHQVRHLADRSIHPTAYKLLNAIALNSNGDGKLWGWTQPQLELAAGIAEGSVKNGRTLLEEKGILATKDYYRGYILPDGTPASEKGILYQLTEKVTAIRSYQALNALATIAPATIAPAAIAPILGHSLSKATADSAIPLRSTDPEKRKKEKRTPAHAPDRPQSAKWRIKILILDIREDKPINPYELRMLVAEAIEDGIPIPDELEETLSRLERHGLIELTSLRKIEGMGWKVPTPLSTLFKRDPAPEGEDDVATLIALHLPKFRT